MKITENKVFRSLFLRNEEIDPDTRRFSTLLFVSTVSFTFTMLMIWFVFFDLVALNDYPLVIMNSIVLLLSFTIYLFIQKTGNIEVAGDLILLTVVIVTLILAHIVHNKNYSLGWTFLFPILAFYLKGTKTGLKLSFLFLALIIIIDQTFSEIPLNIRGTFNILALHISIILASLYYEYSREHNFAFLESEKHRFRKLSIIDPLTQTYNRLYLNEVFDKSLLDTLRDDNFFSFVLLDIDFFKQYNDYYGHFLGDEALKQVTQKLKFLMRRKEDLIFRVGGEEFAGIIHGQSIELIEHYVNTIRKSIRNLEIEHIKSNVDSFLTVSIGAVILRKGEVATQDELYKLADTALYESKESGRNFVTVKIL